MTSQLKRVFFDTNIYILGATDEPCAEMLILDWAGFGQTEAPDVEVVISEVLVQQILRVARRLRGKDWGGELLNRIWRQLRVRYVMPDAQQIANLLATRDIPREDIEIYLTAQAGHVECFVSANRELVRAIAQKTGDFECLTPEEFVRKYLNI